MIEVAAEEIRRRSSAAAPDTCGFGGDSHDWWRAFNNCDHTDSKSVEDCKAKFNNLSEFKGFPRIP